MQGESQLGKTTYFEKMTYDDTQSLKTENSELKKENHDYLKIISNLQQKVFKLKGALYPKETDSTNITSFAQTSRIINKEIKPTKKPVKSTKNLLNSVSNFIKELKKISHIKELIVTAIQYTNYKATY